MAFPALPSDWLLYTGGQKLAWFISKGITADDLTKMGEAASDVKALVDAGLPTGPGVLSQGTAEQQQAAVQEAQQVSDSVAQQYEEIDNNNRRVEALAAELGLPSFIVAGQINAGLSDADIKSIYAPATTSEPSVEDTIRAQVQSAGGDARTLQRVASSYGLSAEDIANYSGRSVADVQQSFRDIGIPLGTALTGYVERTAGAESGVRQLDRGDDVETEKVIGVQGDKYVVQKYDAYGNPTTTRLASPNPSEAQGWLQALGVVGAAVGAGDLLSSLGSSSAAGAGTTSTLAGADAGLGSLASNLTVGEAAGTIANPASIITKPVVNTITDYIVQAVNSSALPSVAVGDATSLGLNFASQLPTTLTTAQVGAIKTAVAAAVNGAASELMGGDFVKGAAGTVIGTALNSVVIPGSGALANDITGDITDPTKIKDLTFNQFISKVVGTGDVITGKLNTAVTNGISSGLTTTLAGGTPEQIALNTGLSFGLGLIGDVKIPGTKLTGDDAQDLIVGAFDEGDLDAVNTLNNTITITGSAGNDVIDPTTFILGAANNTGTVIPAVTNKKYNLLGKEWNTADDPKDKKALIDSLKAKYSIEDIRNAMLELESNITEDEFGFLGLALPDSLSGGAGNDSVTVTGGGLNDGLGSLVTTVGGGGNDTITSGAGNDTLTVKATRESCLAQGKDFDPVLGCVPFPATTTITGGTGNDAVTVTAKCAALGKIPAADGVGCVCPPGKIEQDGICKDIVKDTVEGGGGNDVVCGAGEEKVGNKCEPVCKQGEARGADGVCRPSVTVTSNCASQGKVDAVDEYGIATGGCACPPGTIQQADGTCKAVTQDTVTGGTGNDVVKECPAGYTKNATTGECEIDVVNPVTGIIGALQGSGNKDAGYNPNLKKPFTASRTYTAPPKDYDYYEDPYFQRFGPITYTPPAGYEGAGKGMAEGGLAGLAMAQGGRTLQPRYLGGITDGMADKVPASIDGQRPAALSDGEFVIPADVVSHLGNGNSSAGAKILYKMMDRIRKARTGTTKQGRQINPDKFLPR